MAGRAGERDRLIRAATAAVVCAVAAFAAVVSYSHIYDLGHAHGQDGTAARLLPLSVDGLILAASLVLLHEARNGRGAPALARLMLWLGTVGANIAYGAGLGLLGALISARPAVAFIGVGGGGSAAEPAGHGRSVRPVPAQAEPAHPNHHPGNGHVPANGATSGANGECRPPGSPGRHRDRRRA
jgi:hypothetical protein